MAPRCPYFGQCGGCSFQHMEYSTQLENKRRTAAAALGVQAIKVFSGNEYNYRNRMDFVFHAGGLGLRKKDQWQSIVDVSACSIADPRINRLLEEVRNAFRDVDAFHVKKHSGTYRYALIRATTLGTSVSFVLNSESTRIKDAVEKIKFFADKTSATNVLVTYVDPETDSSTSDDFFAVKGSDVLDETYLGKTFSFAAQGFFQNNHTVAEMMQEYVHNIMASYPTSDSTLLDLYGGVGTFGMVNAHLFKDVLVVEAVEPAIEHARKNIERNAMTNVRAEVLDAKDLKKLSLPTGLFVITDPPRSGMHPKTIEQLNKLVPAVIVYISCNVQQLGREVPQLKGYQIKSTALFDLFPQTPHAEVVVELVRT